MYNKGWLTEASGDEGERRYEKIKKNTYKHQPQQWEYVAMFTSLHGWAIREHMRYERLITQMFVQKYYWNVDRSGKYV